MAHLQVHINLELLKQVKKNSIDQDVSVKEYVKNALNRQIELDRKKESDRILSETIKPEITINLIKE